MDGTQPGPPGWPVSGGEMGALVRAHDWAATPLGPSKAWPQRLRDAVDTALACAFPMIVLWGPDLIQVYNDGYRALMGVKHPAGLGQPTRACWPEVWPINEPIYARVWAGETLTFEDKLYPITRSGTLEDAWFTLCYSPLRGESGTVVGILVTVFETTDRHHAEDAHAASEASLSASEERHAFLLALSDALRPLADPVAIQEAATHVLGVHLAVDRTYYVEIDDARQVAVVERDYVRGTAPSLVGEHPLAPFGSMLRVIRAGRTFAAADAETDPALQADLADYRALALRAFVSVPLVKEGALVAAMCVTSAAPRQWTEGEVALVTETAERTWAAVERARAEAALQASETRFRSFAESSADTLWIVGVATRRLEYLSPAFERMWGEPRDAVLHDLGRWAELVHPDDREEAGRVLPRALAGEAVVADYRIVRASDGAVRWIRDTGFPICDEEGRVVRVAGIAQDITDQKAIEAALRDSEERQAVLLRFSDALRPLADPREIQAATTTMLRDRLDVGWCYYVELDDEALSTVVLQDAVREGVPSMVGVHDVSEVPDFLAFLRAGQTFNVGDFAHYELVSQPVRDRYLAVGVRSMLGTPVIKEGRLVAWLQVCDTRPRDWPHEAVTLLQEVADRTWDALQRARAEAALREAHATLERRVAERTAELAAAVEDLRVSEGRLRVLLEQMPAALWTTDRELRLTMLTGAAVPALPAPLRHAVGRAVPELFAADAGHEDWSGAPLTAHRRALDGASVDYDVAAGGRTYAVYVEPLRDGAGQIVGVIGVAHDVTDRTLLRLQDEFLALASHELRTPLTPAMGYLEMAPQALAAGDPERAGRYVARATEQVQRLNELVGDLLDVGRLRGGKLDLAMDTVDLGAVARRAVEAAGIEAGAQGQMIALDAPPEPLSVRGDAGRLEQVVLNLLTNALKYAPESPTIDVRLRRERDANRAAAVLEVQDYGGGIAAADLPHLFSRFYQVARPDRPSRGGLGLGLYLVQELVEAHGGRVTVASTVGAGTTFTVRVPLAAADRTGTQGSYTDNDEGK